MTGVCPSAPAACTSLPLEGRDRSQALDVIGQDFQGGQQREGLMARLAWAQARHASRLTGGIKGLGPPPQDFAGAIE